MRLTGHIERDPRQTRINVALIVTLAVGLCSALLRAFVLDGAQKLSASLVIAVAIAAYGVLQLINPSSTMHRLVYFAIIAAGLSLAVLRLDALLLT